MRSSQVTNLCIFVLMVESLASEDQTWKPRPQMLPQRERNLANPLDPSEKEFSKSSANKIHLLLSRNEDDLFRRLEPEEACQASLCEQALRHAHGLSRLKLIRRYIRDTVETLDRLVTAMDSEMISIAETASHKSRLSCPGAQAVLMNVLQNPFLNDRFS